jgi:hypothetical protein
MGVLGLANCAADRRGCNRMGDRGAVRWTPRAFHAPIAAIVGLNVTVGRNGSNAVRLLIGVVLGIAVAELVVEFAGG